MPAVCLQRGLTGRSRRHATALAREARLFIVRLAGQCRCVRLTSNVRPRARPCCFGKAANTPAPATLARNRTFLLRFTTDVHRTAASEPFALSRSRNTRRSSVSWWLALRAGVLRRAVRSLGPVSIEKPKAFTWGPRVGKPKVGRYASSAMNCIAVSAPPEEHAWPNRSVEATRNGIGPRSAAVHVAPREPMPSRAPHLQR